jgi:PEGA domain/Tetratricopeptide repeat
MTSRFHRRGWWAAAIMAGAFATTSLTIASDAEAFGPKIASQAKANWKVKKEAKAAYVKGKAAMKSGDFAAAAEHFKKADELVPGAAPKYQVAVAFDKLGDPKQAVEAYRAFIASNPGEKYADRVVAAGKRVAELEKQLIGKVSLQVSPPGLTGIAVTVDGNPVEGTELELEPGEHTVIVTADGHAPETQTITVRAGEPVDIPIALQPEQALPPPPPPGEVDDGEETPGMGLRIAGYTTFGITVAAGVVTGVFGGMALGSASDFEEQRTTELADDAESQALIADVFLGITGAAAIATGVLLYFGYTAVDDDGGDGGDEASAAIPKVQPYGGPKGGGAALTWSF